MNKLLGNAPRHPGLWLDEVRDTDTDWQHTPISCMPTQTQGQHELVQLSAQLAQLSQQGRWVVLINPPSIGYKQLLANAGVRMDRILLVHAKDEVETLWAMEKALTSGTSSAVITWTQSLDARDNRRLQIVAKSARAMGIVLEEVNSHLRCDTRLEQQTHFSQQAFFNSMH
ncbi:MULTISPECIES: cell division inhibitor SulA [unclassified Shewanella]|uniref:cell division inhibitor SulA n=1 Tax=unclassified Shewanella TaxID=196818 RepID=UPI0020A832E1|nr:MULTISPECIES: SulA-like leucine-rich domain-containing protein [unclassified Shewanella]MCP3129025.1 cell division protein [Shewanella sp. KJ2020]